MSRLPLRQVWKNRAKNDSGFLTGAAARFIEQHGARAKFLHIGLDSERQGAKRIYHSQPYAVFEVPGHGRTVFTIGELENLKCAAETARNQIVRNHMERQLACAFAEYEACKPALDSLMGRVRDIGAGRTLATSPKPAAK